MKNRLVARILYEIAELLDLEEVQFKPRAYRRAAEAVESCGVPIEELASQGRLQELSGVGNAIADKIDEIVNTGRLRYHDELKAKFPVDLLSLTRVEGVGAKTARLLYKELDVKDLNDLENAARRGAISKIKGLGEKTEQKILRGLAETRRVEARELLGNALPLVEELIDSLKNTGLFERIETAGSVRRGRETVGDLDILAISKAPSRASEAFVSVCSPDDILAQGPKKTSIRLQSGLQVDLRIVPKESYGAALQYFTGSQAHNVAIRKRAVARGYKLNEYGVYDSHGVKLAGETEKGVYAALDLGYIPPELREDEGEILLAEKGRLPSLLERPDLISDLHVHTEWSDGKASVQQMARAAKDLGLSHIAITDHYRFSRIVNGLSADDLASQMDEIGQLNEKLKGFRLLRGVEANIDREGSIDVPEKLLANLDIVVAAVHAHFHMERDEMTRRLVRAVKNPYVDVLAHPTGRKMGERASYEADWDEVFAHAAESGTALEINSNPQRLDLSAQLARKALGAGAHLSIGSDAHSPGHFAFLRLGVITARRGWAEKKDVLNSLTLGELTKDLVA